MIIFFPPHQAEDTRDRSIINFYLSKNKASITASQLFLEINPSFQCLLYCGFFTFSLFFV